MINELLTRERQRHPLMQAEDVVKLVFQSMLGCGHLVTDEAAMTARIEAEEAPLVASPSEPLTEDLGAEYVRLNLRAAMREGILPEWIARMMVLSSYDAVMHTRCDVMDTLRGLTAADTGVDTSTLWRAAQALQDDHWLPSHSQTYRSAYAPAYRVVSASMLSALPVLCALQHQWEKSRLLVGIDGPCGSGKSTLGKLLSAILNAPLVRMDDFFTPHHLKTPERLAQPGGNADIERFRADFLQPWLRDGHGTYRPYDCHTDTFGKPIDVPASHVTLVEGSYCLHPDLGQPYDLRIFLTITPEEQRRRIFNRNGAELLTRFEQVWIPLEITYHKAFGLPDSDCLTFSVPPCQG